MGIKESEKRRYDCDTIHNLYDWNGTPALILYCDSCNQECGSGRAAGDAADQARKNGAQTSPGKRLSDPMVWDCRRCVEKKVSE